MPAEVIAALSKLSTQDRGLAESQRICPVTMTLLGSMGTPKKVDVNGTQVFICCEGCRESLLDDPEKYLGILAAANATENTRESAPRMDLPPIEAPQAVRDRVTESHQAPGYSTKRAAGQRKEAVR